MKKILIIIIAFTASAFVVARMVGKKAESVKPSASDTRIFLSPEDRGLVLDVFESYLDYDSAYANSAAEHAENYAAGSFEVYKQNQSRIDSVLHQCISCLKMSDYKQLLSLMEANQMYFYMHPGNTIDNEIGLGIVFAKLYNQVYEERDSFYTKMLPIYEFTKLHMEMLERGGKERHPFYEPLQEIMEKAYRCVNGEEEDSLN